MPSLRCGDVRARGRNEVEEDERMPLEEQAAVHVPPGGGEVVWLLGDTYTLKISGEQTGGAFTLLEAVVPLGGGPPPHIHHLEDEVFVILEGELLVTVAGRTLPAPVGTVISVPKGTQHSYAVVGTTPVRMLFLYVPAGMEKMFEEIGTPAQPGVAAPPVSEEDVAKLLSVAAKYNFTIVPPEGG
jgi:mannose-6-phosphate isomerase-like protein (cupin superfamily)